MEERSMKKIRRSIERSSTLLSILMISTYEYRHVTLPPGVAAKLLSKKKLLDETEWREIGVQQRSNSL
ncbi:cyclin-dependent kinases regulatory subunit 1 [Artemisia annua]|uniref:Cyclin-dependent kinases regulatory subunit 1 n=1 Tax=Artemisia annua TaxID=35608 RepID=A0A2U1PN40_ARTAN|nr:cyclin-dependent kinases regulatory subunit 1 [Artemisia annua]